MREMKGQAEDRALRAKEAAKFSELEMNALTNILPQRFTPAIGLICIQRINVVQSSRGILLGDNNKLLGIECWVIAAGPECKQCKRGDRVLIHPQTQCTSCFYKDEETRLVQEIAILGVINPKEYPSEKYDSEKDCIIQVSPTNNEGEE
jgi:co-chaperonin GroES (HSP10)